MTRKLSILLLGLAALWGRAEEPLRRVSVPRGVLPLLLEQGADRVMMPRADYERLRREAEATRNRTPVAFPSTRPPLSVEVVAELEPDHVRITATCALEGLHEGWNAAELAFENVYWTSATLEGEDAELAGEPGGATWIFFQGAGERELRLEGVTGLDTAGNRQRLRFRVPRAPGSVRMRTRVGTEIDGLTVTGEAAENGVKTLRALPEEGWVEGTLGLDRLYRPEPRRLASRLLQTSRVSPSHEEIDVEARVFVNHRLAERLSFTLPAGLTVQSVTTTPPADWNVSEAEGSRRLELRFPEAAIGGVTVSFTALAKREAAGVWTPADIRLVGADRSWRRQSLLPLEPLRVSEIDYGSAEPTAPSAFRPHPVAEGAVFAWSPGKDGGAPRFRLRRRRGEVEGFATLRLRVDGIRKELRGGVTLLPGGEGLFGDRFTLPAEWRVDEVTTTGGRALPFERLQERDGMRAVRVDFPALAPAGRPVAYHFTAGVSPEGWLEGGEDRAVSFPRFGLPNVDRLTGALAAETEPGRRLRAENIEGLTPLDERTRRVLNFHTGDQVPGYRFETADFALEMRLEPVEPEIRVEAFSFFTLGTHRTGVRIEWVLENRRAPLRAFSFTLPVELPRGATPTVDGAPPPGEVLREPDGSGGERWTVPMAADPGQNSRLVLESELPRRPGERLRLPLPGHPDTGLQSGFFAVEGLPELVVRLENAPREVDLGELSGAEYRPGPRLLGSHAYSGPPPEVWLTAEPRPLIDTSATRVRRLRLYTRLSITGEAQTRAVFTLERPPAYLGLRLPENAVGWSAETNGEAVELRRGDDGEWLIPVLGSGEKDLHSVRVVYAEEVKPTGPERRRRMRAPRLSVHADGRAATPLDPVETLWELRPPEGMTLMNSRGNMLPDRERRPGLAAVKAGAGLINLAGGVRSPMDWYRLFLGNTLKSGVMRSRKYSDAKNIALESASEIEDAEHTATTVSGARMEADEIAEPRALEPSYDYFAPQQSQEARQSRQAPSWKIRAGKPEGYRSLNIRLDASGEGIGFHSLNPAPVLDVSLLREETLDFLSLAAGLLVFAAGVWPRGADRRGRGTFVFAALLVSALPGVFPFLSAWTAVFNAVFAAAACLLILYGALWLGRKLWRPVRRPVIVCLAFLMGLGARGEEPTPLPSPIPADVVVEVRPAAPDGETVVLAPRERIEALRALLETREETRDPAVEDLGWLGGVVDAEVGEGATLDWTGLYRFRLRGKGTRAIPFPVEGAELRDVRVDGAVARLRRRDGTTDVLVEGEGVHELSFTLRAPVVREAGARSMAFQLPPVPGLLARVAAPKPGLRVEMAGADLHRVLDAKARERTLSAPVGRDGRVRLRWYRPAGREGRGGGPQVDSLQVLTVSRDVLTLVADLTVTPGGAPMDRVRLGLPEDWRVHAVEGEAVGGWERGEGENRNTARVAFRREVAEPVEIRLSLWRPRADGETGAEVPALPVAAAVRQTGTVVLRSADGMEVRTAATERVQRVETPGNLPRPPAELVQGENISVYRSYGFHTPDYRIDLTVERPERTLEARWQGLLRLAESGDLVEARCAVAIKGPAAYELRFELPPELELTRVRGPGVAEWSVEEGRLRVFAPGGLRDDPAVVMEGRLPPRDGGELRRLPDLRLSGASTQSGEWVVQTDPSVDVEVAGETEMRRIAISATHGWLDPEQRSFARLALSFTGEVPAPGLRIARRKPDVRVTTFTNLRINHQVIEETLLVEAEIRRAGLREFRLRVPARFRGARIKAPLLREARFEPVPDRPDWLDMTVTLQDEVMEQLVILLERDRGAGGGVPALHPPEVLTGRARHAFLTVENAGRDEIRVASSTGLEPLTRGHAEWRTVAGMLGDNVTFAFLGTDGGTGATLELERVARERAVTAGGRIGLSRVDLRLDGEGAYLGRWTAWVDNRTEPSLRASLPEGARLVGASVAGKEVRALRVPGGAEPNTLGIPLVKTPRGERDIRVELVYAGTLESFAVLRRDGFPFPKSLNLPVDLSQATLYLPETRRWPRFDGSMRQVEDEARFEAGWLKYQAGLAERLTRTLKSGDVFEQARATYNIGKLKSDLSGKKEWAEANNEEVRKELKRADEALDKAEEELKRAGGFDQDAVRDNRLAFQSRFESQSNVYSRNQVLLNDANFEQKQAEAPADRANAEAAAGREYDDMRQVLRDAPSPPDSRRVQKPGRQKVAQKARGGRRQQAARYLDTLGEDRPDTPTDGDETGSASLFPEPDPSRVAVYRFTTPRGDMTLTALSVPNSLAESLIRAAVFAPLLLGLLWIARRGRASFHPKARTGTGLLLLGLTALFTGFLPVAAVGMIVWGLVLKSRSAS